MAIESPEVIEIERKRIGSLLKINVVPCGIGYEYEPFMNGKLDICEQCGRNEYKLESGNFQCLACPPNTHCENNNITSNYGYWIDYNSSPGKGVTVYYCPNQKCIGGNKCSDNREGILCGACKEGYSGMYQISKYSTNFFRMGNYTKKVFRMCKMQRYQCLFHSYVFGNNLCSIPIRSYHKSITKNGKCKNFIFIRSIITFNHQK